MTDRETTMTAYADDKYWTFYSCEDRWIRKIEKFAEEYPDDVRILSKTASSINCHISKRFIVLRAPRKVSLTEEQKQIRRENLLRNRKRAIVQNAEGAENGNAEL